MRIIELNIGLNNNPFNFDQLNDLIRRRSYFRIQSRYNLGVWEGQPEPTYVGYMYSRGKLEYILQDVAYICEQTTQQAIAVKIDGVGYLISKDGVMNGYDEKYFLTL